jgi:flavin-dependent dehydrogenase
MIYDIIIIGAGPSGLTAAKYLSKKGLKILILDKGKIFPKRKDLICGWFGNGFSELARIELNKNCEAKESFEFLKEISKQKFLKKSQVVNFSYNSSLKISQYFKFF